MKTKLIDFIVRLRARINRGKGYYNDLREAVILAMALKLFNIPILIIGHIGFYLIGFIDEKYIKLWLAENEFNTKTVNPYFQKLERGFKNVRYTRIRKKKIISKKI